jgi:hypothetical protein
MQVLEKETLGEYSTVPGSFCELFIKKKKKLGLGPGPAARPGYFQVRVPGTAGTLPVKKNLEKNGEIRKSGFHEQSGMKRTKRRKKHGKIVSQGSFLLRLVVEPVLFPVFFPHTPPQARCGIEVKKIFRPLT